VRFRRRRTGLRTRILFSFGFGSLLLAGVLALTTYGFTRTNLVEQRDRSAVNQAYGNARRLVSDLRSNPPSIQPLLGRLDAQRPLVRYRGAWTAGDARFTNDQLPDELEQRVIADLVPSRMTTDIDGVPMLAVGIPLPEVEASYFEFASLEEVDDTLTSVGLSLLLAAGLTTLLGAVLGSVAAQRAVQPLVGATEAARTIAAGRFDTRIEQTEDPDLDRLADAFNEMAAALQQRVERDARFASDVSHELRSPLMTLSASIGVLESRRDDLPERAQAAVELLAADVERFKGLVEDLLEISRFDVGGVRLLMDEMFVAEFVRQAVAVSSLPEALVAIGPGAEELVIRGDRRRLARVIANLLDNARLHGAGEVTVRVERVDDIVWSEVGAGSEVGNDPQRTVAGTDVRIAVEDRGNGVPPEERTLVFERFARGATAGNRASSEGTGLGLALVDEHVRMHGGRVWVEDRLDGEPGARFVIELPAQLAHEMADAAGVVPDEEQPA
jgi:two-component system, OmpR family, sensor histidine kinase MtrB